MLRDHFIRKKMEELAHTDLIFFETVDQLVCSQDQVSVEPAVAFTFRIRSLLENRFFIVEMLINVRHQRGNQPSDIGFWSVFQNSVQQCICLLEQGTVLGVDSSVAGFICLAPDQSHKKRMGCGFSVRLLLQAFAFNTVAACRFGPIQRFVSAIEPRFPRIG